jgi:hypothetical protein
VAAPPQAKKMSEEQMHEKRISLMKSLMVKSYYKQMKFYKGMTKGL